MAENRQTIHWEECRSTLEPLAAEHRLSLADKGRFFECEHLRVRPPLVFPIGAEHGTLEDYLRDLPERPGRHTVVLMQAGAVTLGRFDRGEAVATKSFRRYVVRGKGRAQPLHLKTKGKSRYGSRLRLQNARRLLEETNEQLIEWEKELGPSDRVFYSCPVRLWPELFEATPPPPFERDDAMTKIPLDLPRPTRDVLLRAYRSLEYGSVEPKES